METTMWLMTIKKLTSLLSSDSFCRNLSCITLGVGSKSGSVSWYCREKVRCHSTACRTRIELMLFDFIKHCPPVATLPTPLAHLLPHEPDSHGVLV
ncbi:MAG: hypothetical protein OXC40_07815 [Proteobacteria bacterium]|nr:hypothetical protein [Pseudomonadota bacterium]